MIEGATTVLFRSSHIQVHILYKSQSVETVDRSKLTMLAPTENNLSSKRQLIWPFDASYILQQVLMSVNHQLIFKFCLSQKVSKANQQSLIA